MAAISPLLEHLNTIVIVSLLLVHQAGVSAASVAFPAMFVFGDSIVDPGNNNGLASLAKANYFPHGIDFPYGATGRFCNGRTAVDHISELLGLELIPAFNSPIARGEGLLRGVNYASSGGGILNDTGAFFGGIYPMDAQIQNFMTTVKELRIQLKEETEEFISSSLFFIEIGNNDFLCNYLMPCSTRRIEYSPDEYMKLLAREFTRQLQELHHWGARKFMVAAAGPGGCLPFSIARGDSGTCVEETNNLMRAFNLEMREPLRGLFKNLKGSKLVYYDSFAHMLDIINNFEIYGFKYAHIACCGDGRANGKMICLPGLQCSNRSEYVFWDPFHPTEAANAILANKAYQLLKDNF